MGGLPGIPSLLDQAVGCAASYAKENTESEKGTWRPWQFQPGVREGSITAKVLAVLQATPTKWFEHHALMRLTGGSRGAISWAVRYLVANGMVRTIPSSRQQNYLRYRYKDKE